MSDAAESMFKAIVLKLLKCSLVQFDRVQGNFSGVYRDAVLRLGRVSSSAYCMKSRVLGSLHESVSSLEVSAGKL